jgi:hypothetical protein
MSLKAIRLDEMTKGVSKGPEEKKFGILSQGSSICQGEEKNPS